jgi:hypothetical protein
MDAATLLARRLITIAVVGGDEDERGTGMRLMNA